MSASTLPAPHGPLTIADLRGTAARRRREAAIRISFLGAASVSVIISVLIVLALISEAWDFISRVDLTALVSPGWLPRRGAYDIATLIAGTLVISGIAMLSATRVG